jgi:hypothetical protein
MTAGSQNMWEETLGFYEEETPSTFISWVELYKKTVSANSRFSKCSFKR